MKANTRIAESLYRKALGDGAQSVTAAIFWLKTRAGWKETMIQENKHEGPLVVFRTIVDPPPRDPITGRILALEAPRTS